MTEKDTQQQILAACGKLDTRLFRNNTGVGWVGEVVSDNRVLTPKSATRRVVLNNARPLHAGLHKGSSDLIGWHSMVIEPHHVGNRVAVFVAIEVKSETGTVSEEQSIFVRNAINAGCLAGIARSIDDAQALFEVYGRDPTKPER